MKQILLGTLIFLFSLPKIQAQACDCPYPVIFLHGWINSDVWWAPFYDDADFQQVWGNLADAPTASDFSPHVFYAMPNAQDTHERFLGIITSRNDDIKGEDGIWNNDGINDDAQWIFPNHNNQLSPGCLYAMNFNNRLNGSGEIIPNSVFSTAPCLNCSDNNEAAIYKQGYLVGKMVDAVLTANPSKKKVILIGHSMGGLNSREYLQRTNSDGSPKWWVDPNSPDGHKVAKLITVGTPHLGSNTMGNLSDLFTAGPETEKQNILPDLFSEAMRDLRYSYDRTFSGDYPGPYQYGGYEDDIPDGITPYHSDDVNCDGDQNDIIVGINVDGTTVEGGSQSFAWHGTFDNPLMPLPTNVRYTYYCSNIVGSGGDGVVNDDRMWLFHGGDGSTGDFNDGLSIPAPLDGVPHRLSDRVTSNSSKNHLQQQGDVPDVIRAFDEGDYPAFAWDIEMDNTYAGMAQVVPNKIPTDGNRSNGVDKDWYVFEVPETTVGLRISLTPTPLRTGRIDFYENPAAYETGNSTVSTTFLASPSPTEIELIANNCLEPGSKYYIRISHDQVAATDWKSPFKLRIEATGVLLSVRAFLEGPFDNIGMMNDDLRSKKMLPMVEPFTNLAYTHVGSGGEEISPVMMATLGNEAIVDWVFIEIRDPANLATVLASKSAILLQNGYIVDPISGCSLFFESLPTGNYYIALRHRNHLPVMTGIAVPLRAGGSDLVDFTDNSLPLLSTTSRKTINGFQVLWAGDANNNKSVDASDRSTVWNFRNQAGYLLSDVTMDGNTDAADRSKTWNNRNRSTQLP